MHNMSLVFQKKAQTKPKMNKQKTKEKVDKGM